MITNKNSFFMTSGFLYEFISRHKYAVLSTVTADGLPESALIGFVVKLDLKIFFDTVSSSRKYRNLVKNPAVALVIGWDSEQTVQFEGLAKIPSSAELEEFLPIYFQVFPDGRGRKENWEDLVYFCVEPKWVRYSDFGSPSVIEELKFP
jgi:general stress protein 26